MAVRPWNAAATQDRADGRYYDAGWRAALAAETELVSITSWNEWHEGTQIEPAAAKGREAGAAGGAGRTYLDYGKIRPDGYIRKTRTWAMRFKDVRVRARHAAWRGGKAVCKHCLQQDARVFPPSGDWVCRCCCCAAASYHSTDVSRSFAFVQSRRLHAQREALLP